ncbi:MAG TPA: nitroreductase family deazaflavin-dependent oxidoreductase [Mycobacteriales bacterium]|nr:nitroreductase family deazaflavin-dependent oxidoreductase [Mycobacteriales bacterium]
MEPEDEYAPSPVQWVSDHVALYEGSGGKQGSTVRPNQLPVVLLSMRGARTGKVRKVPLIRVERDGVYAAVASQGGADKNPAWFHNLLADPHVELRDAEQVFPMTARLVEGRERELWWARAVAVFPSYARYRSRTRRVIPVLVLEPA